MTERAVLIAGGNLGDVRAALSTAREMTARMVGPVEAASDVFVSEPWGFEASEKFLNQVWVVATELQPDELLTCLQGIERSLGRTEKSDGGRYASRTMDIDILFYGERVINTPTLTVPHPLMQQRRFVLEPLAQLMPGRVHPVLGKSIKQLLDEL